MKQQLEKGMAHIAALYKDLPRHIDVTELPGAGAAGGLAGGLLAALDAKISRVGVSVRYRVL